MEPPYAHKRLDVYEPSISTPSPLERKRRPLSIGARVRPQFLVEFWSENRRKIGMERSNIPYGSKHCLRRYLTLQIIPQTLPKKVLGSIGKFLHVHKLMVNPPLLDEPASIRSIFPGPYTGKRE